MFNHRMHTHGHGNKRFKDNSHVPKRQEAPANQISVRPAPAIKGLSDEEIRKLVEHARAYKMRGLRLLWENKPDYTLAAEKFEKSREKLQSIPEHQRTTTNNHDLEDLDLFKKHTSQGRPFP